MRKTGNPLLYIGDVFKNDSHNRVRAKRRLNGYEMAYRKQLKEAAPKEKNNIKLAITKIKKAKELV